MCDGKCSSGYKQCLASESCECKLPVGDEQVTYFPVIGRTHDIGPPGLSNNGPPGLRNNGPPGLDRNGPPGLNKNDCKHGSCKDESTTSNDADIDDIDKAERSPPSKKDESGTQWTILIMVPIAIVATVLAVVLLMKKKGIAIVPVVLRPQNSDRVEYRVTVERAHITDNDYYGQDENPVEVYERNAYYGKDLQHNLEISRDNDYYEHGNAVEIEVSEQNRYYE